MFLPEVPSQVPARERVWHLWRTTSQPLLGNTQNARLILASIALGMQCSFRTAERDHLLLAVLIVAVEQESLVPRSSRHENSVLVNLLLSEALLSTRLTTPGLLRCDMAHDDNHVRA